MDIPVLFEKVTRQIQLSHRQDGEYFKWQKPLCLKTHVALAKYAIHTHGNVLIKIQFFSVKN